MAQDISQIEDNLKKQFENFGQERISSNQTGTIKWTDPTTGKALNTPSNPVSYYLQNSPLDKSFVIDQQTYQASLGKWSGPNVPQNFTNTYSAVTTAISQQLNVGVDKLIQNGIPSLPLIRGINFFRPKQSQIGYKDSIENPSYKNNLTLGPAINSLL